MNNQASTKSSKVRVVRKGRYSILIPFIGWLIFSIWMMSEITLHPSTVQNVKNPLSDPNSSGAIYSGLLALWTLGDILIKKKHNIPISIEQKSFLPFLVGSFLLAIGQYLPFSNYVFYLAFALVDILPITIIIVLLQGKPFSIFRLYHRDVEII